ncbi:hypothetical protein LMG27177_06837 [Paraburkholderia fynbosensis]|uniref:Uncharacterized protein n=1 Tax=Paraburkholderia fynbosensis TaxID=1200993 RepID=A0A6J5H623_9BURK|nr:hypothetical protein LMG27177_06837 [Paraburkholderia fynbosensis]
MLRSLPAPMQLRPDHRREHIGAQTNRCDDFFHRPSNRIKFAADAIGIKDFPGVPEG